MAHEPRISDLRVVIEHTDPDEAHAQQEALRAAGAAVNVCQGAMALPDQTCPVLGGRGCSLIEEADVVLHDLDIEDPGDREVLRSVREAYPQVPIVVEAPLDLAREHAETLEGVTVSPPFDMDALVRTVTDAAAEGRLARGRAHAAADPVDSDQVETE